MSHLASATPSTWKSSSCRPPLGVWLQRSRNSPLSSTGTFCPVCDRDFSEVSHEPLGGHVHAKVRILSASAERLLTLGRTRTEVQVTLERLDRELEALAARQLDEEALAALDRRHAAIEAVITELEGMSDALRQGAVLRAADVAARRVVSEAQSRHISLAAARETLTSFATSAGESGVAEGESFDTRSRAHLRETGGADLSAATTRRPTTRWSEQDYRDPLGHSEAARR